MTLAYAIVNVITDTPCTGNQPAVSEHGAGKLRLVRRAGHGNYLGLLTDGSGMVALAGWCHGFLVLSSSQRVPFHRSATARVPIWPTAMQRPGLAQDTLKRVTTRPAGLTCRHERPFQRSAPPAATAMQRTALGQDTSPRPGYLAAPTWVCARQVRPFHRSARPPTPGPAQPTAMHRDRLAQSTRFR